jgi:hypothetical protein
VFLRHKKGLLQDQAYDQVEQAQGEDQDSSFQDGLRAGVDLRLGIAGFGVFGYEDGLVSRLRLSMGAGSLSRSPENRWRDSFGDGSKVNSVVEGSLRSKIRTGSESGQEAL